MYFRSSGTAGPVQGQVVRQALLGMGFQPGNVTMKGFSGGNIYTAMGVHPNDWDLSVWGVWCSGTRSGFGRPDPAELVGGFANSNAEYRRRFEAAERLRGSRRALALGRLDLEITRKLAPAVVMGTRNVQFLFSDRVAVKSLAYQPSVADWSIASLALK